MYEILFSQSAAGSMQLAKSSGVLEGAANQVLSLPQIQEAGTDTDKLLRAAAGGASLRLWWSDAPDEARGLRCVCSLLEGLPCLLSAVRLPGLMPHGADTAVCHFGWGEVCPQDWPAFLPYERPLSAPERRALAMDWRRLVQEDAPLHAVINGRLVGVPVDFYDFLIRRCVPDGEFPMYELIGRILSHALGLGDAWIAGRIGEMTERGELELIRDDPRPYGKILRKTEKLPPG